MFLYLLMKIFTSQIMKRTVRMNVFGCNISIMSFCKKLDQLEIRIDSDTVKRLYKALTLEQYQSKSFYIYWIKFLNEINLILFKHWILLHSNYLWKFIKLKRTNYKK